MMLEPADLSRYSKSEYLEAFERLQSWEKVPKYVRNGTERKRVIEIMRYVKTNFLQRYGIAVGELLENTDFVCDAEVLTRLRLGEIFRKMDQKVTSGYFQMGLLVDFRRKILDIGDFWERADETAQGIYVTDDNFHIIDLNHSFAKMLGYEKHEILGKTIYDFLDSENIEILNRQVKNIKSTVNREYHMSLLRKDGTEFPVIINATSRFDEKTGGVREVVIYVTDRRKMSEQINEANRDNHTDYLTGAYNRRYFDKEMDKYFNMVSAGKLPSVCLALVDADRFKSVNDIQGHQAGDQVLKEITAIMKELPERQFIVVRFGGDEFAVLGVNVNMEKMSSTMERIRQSVESKYSGKNIPMGCNVTLSIGLAEHKRSESSLPLNDIPKLTIERFCKNADCALYLAKEQGKNKVVVYADEVAMA